MRHEGQVIRIRLFVLGTAIFPTSARPRSSDQPPINGVSFFQSPRDHIDLPGAVDMRAGSDLGLVRLARRVPPLEREEEAEALRRALRPHALLLQRHA